MKRIFNMRILLVCLVALMFGILFVHSQKQYLLSRQLTFSLVLCIVVISCVAILYITSLFFIKTKEQKNKYLAIFIHSLNKHRNVLLSAIIFFVVGSVLFHFAYKDYQNYVTIDAEECIVSARVIGDDVQSGSSVRFQLDDITVEVNEKSYELSSTAFMYLYYSDNISYEFAVGDKVTFVADITSYKLEDDYYPFVNDRVYSFFNVSDIERTGHSVTFDEKVREGIKDVLLDNMNYQNAGLAFSVLFGSQELLTSEVKDAFSYSGLSHLLAVSGLNVVFLVALLAFFLKKLRVNKYVNFAVTFVVILFYCYLCSFTPSVVRAAIMSIIVLFSYMSGKEYDGLSSLSFAGILILFLSPFSLFNIGFQLSFISVFSIISLNPTIMKLFNKWKIPAFISTSLAITISSNIGIVLVSMTYFNRFALLGVLSNIIVLPLFSITYMILFCLSFLILAIKPLGWALVLPDVLLHFVKIVANWVSSLPYNIVTLFEVGFGIILLLFVAIFFVQFLMINKRAKVIMSVVLSAVIVLSIAITNIPIEFSSNAVLLTYQTNTNYSIFVGEDNKKILVGMGNPQNNYLENFVMDSKIKQIDAWILPEVSLRDIDYMNNIISEHSIRNVYIATVDDDMRGVLDLYLKKCNVMFISADERSCYEYLIKAHYYDGKSLGVSLNINGKTTLVLNDNVTEKRLASIDGDFNTVIVAKSKVHNLADILGGVDAIITYGATSIVDDAKVDIMYKRNFTLAI